MLTVLLLSTQMLAPSVLDWAICIHQTVNSLPPIQHRLHQGAARKKVNFKYDTVCKEQLKLIIN